jgi:ferric-chelate reductase
LHNTYRWIPYAFWALVFVIITGHRILESMTSRLHLSGAAIEKDADAKAISHHSSATWSSGFGSHILLAPAFGRRFYRGFGWFTGGTRLQALTILCYIIIHIAIMSVRYPTLERNIYYKSREIQRLRYVSDRVGVLMSSSLPFIWLFGTRNNFFLWATGLSFSTMQIFHRWVSVIWAIEGIIHGTCFTAYYLQRTPCPLCENGGSK